MTMTPEDSETFRKELIAFGLRSDLNRIEFTLSHWHVTMYRIRGQTGLVRVDFHERDTPRLKPFQPRVINPKDYDPNPFTPYAEEPLERELEA